MTTRISLLVPVALAAALAACSQEATQDARREGAQVGQRLEGAIDRTQQKLAEAGEKTQRALSGANERLQPKLEAAGDRIAEATDKVAANMKEAVRPDGSQPASRAEGPDGSRAITTTVTTGPSTSISGLPEGTREALSDGAITAAVKAGFVKDPGLSALRIDVDTNQGVVTLNGLADDEAARERAARIAGEVRGVKEVRNHLSVKRG